MNKFDLCQITFKFLGVASILKAIDSRRYFVLIPISFTGESGKLIFIQTVLTSIIPFILLLIAGITLWLRSDNFARLLLKDVNSESKDKFNINSEDIKIIVFSSIGLLILVTSIPELVQMIARSIIINKQEFFPAYEKSLSMTEVIRVGIQFILGLVLFLSSRGIVNLLNTLRDAGVRKKL